MLNVNRVSGDELPHWEDVDSDLPVPGGIELLYAMVVRNVAGACARAHWVVALP